MTEFEKECEKKVLVVLQNADEKKSRIEIELSADISRPATAKALKTLREKKLIKRRTRSRNHEGIGKEVLYWLREICLTLQFNHWAFCVGF